MNFNELIKQFESDSTESAIADNKDLQRTEDWHAQRLGNFTGSRMGELMTCKSKARGKSWDNLDWLFDFGDTAITYIIERAIERATNTRIESAETWQMRWGTYHEPFAKQAFAEAFGEMPEEVGFTFFAKNAGASPDGYLRKINAGFEVKCPATAMSHYKLMNEAIAENHTYFWQLQSEMLSLKVIKLIFATYCPFYPENAQIAWQEVQLSKIHAFAMLFRIKIANNIVEHIINSNFRVSTGEIIAYIAELKSRFVDHQDVLKFIEDERKEIAI